MLVKSRYHVSYCTNSHPGEDWNQTQQYLKNYLPQIKERLSPHTNFGVGLRLSNKASEELEIGNNLFDFKTWLDDNELYVFTLNGFPYGNFHGEKVKDAVHAPDWTTTNRLIYTQRLFRQLTFLLPEGMEGGVSTSPISYKYWYNSEQSKMRAFSKASEHYTKIVIQLIEIESNRGIYLHLDIEPEPDGLLENSEDLVNFFDQYLLPIGKRILNEVLGVTDKFAEELILRHITVCYDVCHFSLAYEEPEDSFEKFKKSGIKIGKIQVSAALKVLYDAANPEIIWESLAKFNEPVYLHQVTEKFENEVRTYKDLPVILENKKDFTELRAHFHVPIYLQNLGVLYSTQDQIIKVLRYLKTHAITSHLEVETYTWDVLPESLQTNMVNSITSELEWLIDRL